MKIRAGVSQIFVSYMQDTTVANVKKFTVVFPVCTVLRKQNCTVMFISRLAGDVFRNINLGSNDPF